jgi:predicted dienelactone hydrolase
MTKRVQVAQVFAALALLMLTRLGVADSAPSRFGVDAPELARLGEFAVGVRVLHLVDRLQVDVLAFDATRGTARTRDRELTVDLWYPARAGATATAETYTAAFPSEAPGATASFSVPGIAVRDAKPAGTGYPLVIVSHGYSNAPAAMTWLTENLASKGYVVAAIRHEDPSLTDPAGFPQPLLRRPLDIAFVAKSLRASLGAEHLVDPTRVALIGYSMGGYGVLTSAGAGLDPNGATKFVPGGLLLPYTVTGAERDQVLVKDLRAVVAISPAGGGALAAWGSEGLRMLKVPLLLIAGDHDQTVDYKTGARSFFDQAVNAQRYLLTFEQAGHSIGLNPAPEAMRQHLWDQDWFEDPVWRKERVNAINAHFITAFLDCYLKGDASRAAYLDVGVTESFDGAWAADKNTPYAAPSPGGEAATLWKGFQRHHNTGLELLQAPAAASGPGP